MPGFQSSERAQEERRTHQVVRRTPAMRSQSLPSCSDTQDRISIPLPQLWGSDARDGLKVHSSP